MPKDMEIYFIAGFALVFILALVFSSVHQKRLRRRWQALAQKLGLHYEAVNSTFHTRLGLFQLFSYGNERTTYDLLNGQLRGVEVFCGNFRYATGSGRNRSVSRQTVLVMRSPRLCLPHCLLRRQSLFDFFGKLFGGQDIDFEEDPEFSRAFVLQGRIPSATRWAFNPEVRRRFLRFKDRRLHFECSSSTLVIHFGEVLPPERVPVFINEAFFLLDGFTPAQEV